MFDSPLNIAQRTVPTSIGAGTAERDASQALKNGGIENIDAATSADGPDLTHSYNGLCHASDSVRLKTAEELLVRAKVDEEVIHLFRYFLATSIAAYPSTAYQDRVFGLCCKVYRNVRRQKSLERADALAAEMVDMLVSTIDVAWPHAKLLYALALLDTAFNLSETVRTACQTSTRTLLLRVLIHSPYEFCRERAYQLLKKQPVLSAEELLDLATTAEALSVNVRTLERLRGGMAWRFLASCDSLTICNGKSVLRHMLDNLATALEQAKDDYTTVAPMIHGMTECIAYVIHDCSPETRWDPVNKDFVLRLVDTLRSACDTALGFFTETKFLELGSMEDCGEDTCDGDNGTLRGTLVACAWRTIRAVGSSLVDLSVALIPFYGTMSAIAVDLDSDLVGIVKRTGSMLQHILLTVIHWGAANWTQTSLTRLCEALARSSHDDLRKLPDIWLQDIFPELNRKIIRHDERHAGSARVVIALLNGGCVTVPQKVSALNRFLELLLPLGNEKSCGASTVAIITWMVKDAKLGQAMPVEKLLNLAMVGLESNEQAVRNASGILFSAILSKYFTGNVRHSGKLGIPIEVGAFFKQYPNIFSHMLTALDGVASSQLRFVETLYPHLMLLSRLQPGTSQLIAHDSPSAIISERLIKLATKNCIQQVREKSSKCLASLLPPEAATSVLCTVWSEVVGRSYQSEFGANGLHGRLCLINAIIEKHDGAAQSLRDWHLQSSFLALGDVATGADPISRSLLMKISAAAGLFDIVSLDATRLALPQLDNIRLGRSLEIAAAIHFSLNKSFSMAGGMPPLVSDFLRAENDDVVKACLQWLISHSKANTCEPDTVHNLLSLWQRLPQPAVELRSLIMGILTSQQLQTDDALHFLDLLMDCAELPHGYAMLRCETIETAGQIFSSLSDRDSETRIGRFLRLTGQVLHGPVLYLNDLRMAVSKAINSLKTPLSLREDDALILWQAVVTLLCDPDEDVYGPASSFVSRYLAHGVPIHRVRALEVVLRYMVTALHFSSAYEYASSLSAEARDDVAALRSAGATKCGSSRPALVGQHLNNASLTTQ
ncbi:hypothetical protein BC832DRAFT_548813 [Gaertneriomyces semiglobifer]|nr:hypothetical protein BC832DRAFT_548813 [Gaertneriomyces semiglobifer]